MESGIIVSIIGAVLGMLLTGFYAIAFIAQIFCFNCSSIYHYDSGSLILDILYITMFIGNIISLIGCKKAQTDRIKGWKIIVLGSLIGGVNLITIIGASMIKNGNFMGNLMGNTPPPGYYNYPQQGYYNYPQQGYYNSPPGNVPIPPNQTLNGIFCPNCGSQNVPGAKFCQFCGKPMNM
jgi:hypothetical protein